MSEEDKKMEKELSIIHIYENEKLIGYGGNQDWFLDSWAQKAGCASVLASQLYAYYLSQESTSKHDFLEIMNQMYQRFTPGKMGYPFLYKFARTFCQTMKEHHVFLKPIYLKKPKSYEQAIDFVKTSIYQNHPVSLLILFHQAPELEEDNWHWVCITGYKQNHHQEMIIFSDCGERREIDAHILFDINKVNVFKMVSMKNDPQK